MNYGLSFAAAAWLVVSVPGAAGAQEPGGETGGDVLLEEPGELDLEPVEAPDDGRSLLMDFHLALGATALSSFTASLIIGAGSGNIGKLMDPAQCCSGERLEPYRTIDRVLVLTGISTYVGAGLLALYNLLIQEPAWEVPRETHQAHRWLAIAHFTVFLASAATGIVMFVTQDSDPELFADVAQAHVASNFLLVPLLATAMSDILFE
jgi:hypothetical protein